MRETLTCGFPSVTPIPAQALGKMVKVHMFRSAQGFPAAPFSSLPISQTCAAFFFSYRCVNDPGRYLPWGYLLYYRDIHFEIQQ